MKGLQGIVIAAALGIIGAVCNWFYISRQADNYERVSFVAISPGTQLKAGDRFKKEHFTKVDIPRNQVGNLDVTAVKWRDLAAVTHMFATRSYDGSEILLQQDLKTPARQDLNKLIGKDEMVMWLSVDSRTFNPMHVNPGDRVSFKVPRFAVKNSSSINGSDGNGAEAANSGPDELIGPFLIVSLGDRRGRREIQKAAGKSVGAENVIGIAVKKRGNGLEPKAQRLSDILQLTNFRGIQLLLHPALEDAS